MITATTMEQLRAELEALKVAAANGSLNRGMADVLLDRVNTIRNHAFDTPYLRTLDAMYTQIEAIADQGLSRAG